MYYENVITEIEKTKKMLSNIAKKFKQTKFESAEMTLRKTVDATGNSGRNLADVFGIYDYPTLFRAIQSYARQRKWEYFEIGDYIIVPNININGANYTNIRFILTGINSYDGIGNAGSYIPGLVFSAYNVLYNDTWLNVCDNDDIINNAGQYINNSIGQNLNSAWHYNSQRRQAFWKSNSAFILSEQELSNPMRSYTIGNTHSNHMLPLYKRSSLSKYRYNLSNEPSPFWLSNKDQYNSLWLEAVYRTEEYLDTGNVVTKPNLVTTTGPWGPYNSMITVTNYKRIYDLGYWYNIDGMSRYAFKEVYAKTDGGGWSGNGTSVSSYWTTTIIRNILNPSENGTYSNTSTAGSKSESMLTYFCAKGYRQVFDHYNYHYELGALYQQINKLSIDSLYNASSGVTFSIYA